MSCRSKCKRTGCCAEELRSLAGDNFLYIRERGEFIWKTSKGKSKVGNIAGSIKKHGYRMIKVSGKYIYAHRLVWLMHNECFPTGEIDHINQDKLDNRIENLRDVNRVENARNHPLVSSNKSGKMGVCFASKHGNGPQVLQSTIKNIGLEDMKIMTMLF